MATGWAAARLRLRSEVRTTRAGLALLVAVLALSAGVAMAAVAGARRSDSAYGRFLTWTNVHDLVASGCFDIAKTTATYFADCTDEQADDAFARVRTLPFVQDSALLGWINVSPVLPDGTRPSFLAFGPAIDLEGRIGRDLPRVKVLR